MTQAFNLSQLANNLNTAGQLDATDGLTGATPVANGGTGQSTLTANAVVLGNGTSAVTSVAPSTAGNLLTSNGTTWVSSTLSVGISNFNTYYASNAVAGTTTLYSTFTSIFGGSNNSQYPPWQDSGYDYISYEQGVAGIITANMINITATSAQYQFGLVALVGGVYRLTWTTDNTSATQVNESRVLVNGTQVYIVTQTGETATNRTYDVSVNPFDQIVLQYREFSGTGASYIFNYKVGTTGGGLVMTRT